MAKDTSQMGPVETVRQSISVPQSGYGMKPVFTLGAFAALVVIPAFAVGVMSTAQGMSEHADQKIAAESTEAEQPGGGADGNGAVDHDDGDADTTAPSGSDSDDPTTDSDQEPSADDRDDTAEDTAAPGSEPSDVDPDRGSDHTTTLPGDSVASGELFYAEDAGRPTNDVIHIVEPGDTLSGISGYYGVPLDAIAEYNHIMDPNVIYIDAALVIPYSIFE